MTTTDEKIWKAPDWATLPDFIICGAMKCGTSTVHSILEKHSDVFIPKLEINFFDMDDVLEHSDFLFHGNNLWAWPDFRKDRDLLWQWYSNFFKPAGKCQILGEDSTCYLPSYKASKRISFQDKKIKTIVCLRDPVKRTYSQYLHMLRSGRAIHTFEDAIVQHPYSVLNRSMYDSHLENFLSNIERENVFFFVLEEFRENKQKVTENLLDFLELDKDKLPKEAMELHSNPAHMPKSLKLQLMRNRIFQSQNKQRYLDHLPHSKEAVLEKQSLFMKLIERIHSKLNPLRKENKIEIRPETERFLKDYFELRFQNLDILAEKEITKYWFS